ncbi:MAG: hypothetical protein DSO04_02185 [Hadesarchaea archaeon]|nr:MAG: hypothetical protein DSO04_02185 [Hadesarchaea archaeon]
MDRTRMPSLDTSRMGRYDETITFMDDRGRTYVLVIPAEELEGKSEEEQARIIAERARALVGQRSSWTGRELSIA